MQTIVTPHAIPAITCPEIELKIASTREERQGAFELIYRSYLRAGLCTESFCGFRATSYQLLPTTDIFVAKLRDEVISTVSLVRDGHHGLPMEEIYPEEIAVRRQAGVRVAEVSCLADRRRDSYRYFGLFCELGRLLAQLAIKQNIDELLVAVHPRHASLYRRYMTFQRIGDERTYPTVQANPAVALSLNFSRAKAEWPVRWNKFFGPQLSDDVLRSCPVSIDDKHYFGSALDADGVEQQGFPPAAAWNGDCDQVDELAMCA
jgi:hypothetical protein